MKCTEFRSDPVRDARSVAPTLARFATKSGLLGPTVLLGKNNTKIGNFTVYRGNSSLVPLKLTGLGIATLKLLL